MERRVAEIVTAAACAAAGAVLLQFGRALAPVEDGDGIGWSLLAVFVTIAAASTAGGLDLVAVRDWLVRNRVGVVLLVAPAVVSGVLVALGVRAGAWLTDPTPVGALGLGLVLAAVPLSRGRRPRQRPARA